MKGKCGKIIRIHFHCKWLETSAGAVVSATFDNPLCVVNYIQCEYRSKIHARPFPPSFFAGEHYYRSVSFYRLSSASVLSAFIIYWIYIFYFFCSSPLLSPATGRNFYLDNSFRREGEVEQEGAHSHTHAIAIEISEESVDFPFGETLHK